MTDQQQSDKNTAVSPLDWPRMAVMGIFILAVAGALLWRSETVNRDLRDALLQLSVEQLRTAVLASAPYDHNLALVQKLAGSTPEFQPALKVLAGSKSTGIVSMDNLKAGYDAAASEALMMETTHPGLGVVGQMAGEVAASAVQASISFDQNIFSSEVGPVLARGNLALSGANLEEALLVVAELPVYYSTPFTSWVAQARARSDAIAALQALTRLESYD